LRSTIVAPVGALTAKERRMPIHTEKTAVSAAKISVPLKLWPPERRSPPE
jgi:hypothetical protein